MKKKNKGGRPTLMTPETLAKLEQAYSFDATDVEACLWAGITKTTLYNYQQKHPEFVDRKEQLKKSVTMHAKRNIQADVLNGEKNTSKWVLERRAKEDYSTQVNSNQRFVDKEGEDLHEKDLAVLKQLGLIS